MQPARQRVLPCFVDVFDLMVTSYGCLDVRLARMASNVQPNCGTLLTLTLVLKVTLRLLGGVQRQQRLWCAPFCIHNCTHELKRCVRGLTRFDSHRAVQHAARDIARAERTRCGRDRGSGVCFSTAGVAAHLPPGENPLEAERSHSGTAVMNDGEGHQRSFSVRPSERPLHRQDRVLASGWHQALGEGPVSHGAKWHSQPEAVLPPSSSNRAFSRTTARY